MGLISFTSLSLSLSLSLPFFFFFSFSCGASGGCSTISGRRNKYLFYQTNKEKEKNKRYLLFSLKLNFSRRIVNECNN